VSNPKNVALKLLVSVEKLKTTSISKLLKKIDNTPMIDRQPGSGRQISARTDTSAGLVEDLVQIQENQPQILGQAGRSYFEHFDVILFWSLYQC